MWRGNFQLKYGDDRIFVLLTARSGALKVAWLIEIGVRAQSCLVYLKSARTLKVAWLIEMGAREMRGLVIFLLLLVAAKS